MNKTELLAAIADQTGESKKTIEAVLDSLAAVTTTALKNGDEVTLMGLGKFTATRKPERQGRNPSTGEAMTIAAKNAPKFSASKTLKDALNS